MRYIKAIYIGLIGMLLAGCQADQWESIEGGFQITLSDEVTVTTKSTPAELGEPTTDKFKLKIVNEATNNAAYDGAYKSGTIPAAAGTYTITATFGENPVLALDDPYYKGEKTSVVVKDGETTSVNISCTVANALATIFYADTAKFDEMYSSYGVEIKVNNYSVTIGDGTKESAYYQAGSKPTFTFKGVLKGNNKEVSKILEDDLLSSASTFEARKHCKLTLSMEATASGLVPTISKAEATTVTINETIPMEWLPAPKVNGFNDDNQTSLTYTETEDALSAQLRFSGSLAIQDVEFSFEFEDPQEKFQALNNKSFVLSELTEKDRSLLNAASIILPNLDKTNSGQFDFTAMTSSLQTKGNGEETTNTIKLRVKANNRWSSEEPNVYEIRTVKPEFNISVNEANCWSREFTIEEITVSEGKGNLEKIKENLIYQYYNGNDWVECTTRDNVKGRTQQFKEAAESIPSKEYRVRALYRGAIASSEATATLETPTQLPNGNMDEWGYTESSSNNSGNEGSIFNPRYTYIPIYKLTSSFWSTNNDYTTRYSNRTFGRPYNCFPAVSYVPGRLGGKAAELRNTASGAGNTNAGSISVIDNRNKVAGILFTGDFECESGGSATNYSYTKTNGKEFESRPTSLKFWYKYLPYTSDTWQAHIELWDKDKNIIIQQDFQSSLQKTDYEEVEIKLDYNNQQSYPVCKYIYIIFQSTITEGENMLFEKFKDTYVLWKDEQQYTYNELHVGSVLTIDDISLVYDK